MQIQQQNILNFVESVSNKIHGILPGTTTIYKAHQEINGKKKNRLGVIFVG
jgi:hypothetical protein